MSATGTGPDLAAEQAFNELVAIYDGQPDISTGTMFNSPGLRVHNKIFAMLMRRRELGLKLPADRCRALVDSGRAGFLSAGGRQMREWIYLMDDDRADWPQLAAEAFAFVLQGVLSSNKPQQVRLDATVPTAARSTQQL